MDSSLQNFLLFPLFLFLLSLSNAQKTTKHPEALVLPVSKDGRTLQYLTHIHQRTPLVSVKLVVDVGGQSLWVNCDSAYVSSSYRSFRCRSIQCSTAQANICNTNSCFLYSENCISGISMNGELGEDVIAIPSKSGPIITIHNFLFSCAPAFLLQNLATGVEGMLGLGRSRIALPSQLASASNFHRKFAICLPASTTSNGVIFFGDSPILLLPNVDLSKTLMYTPLIINPVSTAVVPTQGDTSSEYFIGVKSIKINGKRLSLNASLLSIDKEGVGGTKISTTVPYTTLEASIYNTFTKAFIKAMTSMNMSRVASVAPFEVCFSSRNMDIKQVPAIDLVLQSEMVYWRILGMNSMVRVRDDVLCLGFLGGGSNPRSSIVIGGLQLENNLLEFDLATSRLGFRSSLLLKQTTCSSFEFINRAYSL